MVVESETTTVALHPYTVAMVKPKRCILGNSGYFGNKGFEAARCKGCQFKINASSCAYKRYEVVAATGSHELFDKDYQFIHWCCAKCGELLKVDNYVSYVFEDLSRDQHICKNCGTIHIHLDTISYDFNQGESIEVFAIPSMVVRDD